MSLAYADEKFSATVRSLATGRGRIKERLIDSCIEGIANIQAERDIPEVLRQDFRQLVHRLNRDWPTSGNHGRIHATVENMTEDEAVEMAQEILAFADRIEGALEDEREGTG